MAVSNDYEQNNRGTSYVHKQLGQSERMQADLAHMLKAHRKIIHRAMRHVKRAERELKKLPKWPIDW